MVDRAPIWREQPESSGPFGDAAIEPPPFIGSDERRMQVRAYRFWTSLLKGAAVPRLADLDLHHLPDFGPSSLLVDFSGATPGLVFVGENLRAEAGLPAAGLSLDQIPPRSLMSRLTDRCTQVASRRAALGFEAEFTNHRGNETLYRGLLLPFSSDGMAVDHVYGVISWKEVADRRATRDVGKAFAATSGLLRARPDHALWRDGPVSAWLHLSRRRA